VPPQKSAKPLHVKPVVLVVSDVDVDVELVDVDDRDVDELDDDEVDVEVVGPSEDELLDDVDVVVLVVLVVGIVVGGAAVLEVVVGGGAEVLEVVVGGGGADELVLVAGNGVSVVDVMLPPPMVLDVVVEVDGPCAGRVVLVVVEARGRLVDVVVVLTGSA